MQEIDVDELAARVGRGEGALIDVRRPAEWDDVHIDGATLITLDELPDRLDELPRDETLLVICRSGARSAVATEALTEPAHHLYRAYGFKPVSGALAMRCDLQTPLPTRALPDGISLASWQPELAGHFYQAYQAAFREVFFNSETLLIDERGCISIFLLAG